MYVYAVPDEHYIFPHPLTANPTGILAYGGDLHPDRLKVAYRFGIFPWYSAGEPLLWWFPDPRAVLFPENIRIARSMRPYFNQQKFSVTVDLAFKDVIVQCRKRGGNDPEETWIHPEMQEAYIQLHEEGLAHSVEVWQNDQLVGGLYGVAMGMIFFGESMFSHVANSSKYGFIVFTRFLEKMGFALIDCQQDTPHMRTLGATTIQATEFFQRIHSNLGKMGYPGKWNAMFDAAC